MCIFEVFLLKMNLFEAFTVSGNRGKCKYDLMGDVGILTYLTDMGDVGRRDGLRNM